MAKRQAPQPKRPASELLPKAKMVSPRPTEVKAVAKLLGEPAVDADDLAKRIIAAVDGLRFGKRTFGVVVELVGEAGSGFVVYGPYPTAKRAGEAQKICENVFPGHTRTATISNTLSVDGVESSYYA